MVTNPYPHPMVGAQLRAAYERMGLTITQLEKLSGVSRKYISLAFEGANISLSILEKLAGALGISAIKVGALGIEMEKASLSNPDVALATTMIERGLNEAMDGVSILRRYDDREDPVSIARQVAAGIRKRKDERTGETSPEAVRASGRRRR